MAFRNNKSIFVPESKKADIYEAAGVSRRTNDQVEEVVGESTPKGIQPDWPDGWYREEEQGSLILLFLPIFSSPFFFSFLFYDLKNNVERGYRQWDSRRCS